jgi:hypothetical protein
MNLPEHAAPTPQPISELFADFTAHLPEHTTAPQSWMVTIDDATYHWYDLIAGFPERPDIKDPIGRYQRRMQFELEAVSEKHHLYLAVTRPKVRFDPCGTVQWGFFSLKLTLPLLVGPQQSRASLSFELQAPFAATLKKPLVTLTSTFVTLNWGGLIEVFSVHDILQQHGHQFKSASQVVLVGQTRDADARLAKARLPALQRQHALWSQDQDTLLLVFSVTLTVSCADGDAADLPHNAHRYKADALRAERMDVIEAALIRHFEGAAPRGRALEEQRARAKRLAAVQSDNNLVQFTIDLALPDGGHFQQLGSDQAPASAAHLLSCFIADGQAVVASMPPPALPAKSARQGAR